MPGVFLSHSSADKPFVRRLASDLIGHDIPVWFDEWELELGQQLISELVRGIDDSSLLLILLSPSSVQSSWVQQELAGALAREQALGVSRQFIVPVLVSDCDVPPAIAGRIWVDFRKGYYESLDRLVSFLRSKEADHLDAPLRKQLVPIVVSRFFNLDHVSLQRRVEYLMSHYSGPLDLSEAQLVMAGDEQYASLRAHFLRIRDRCESEGSHEFRMLVHAIANRLASIERGISKGLLTIINGMTSLRAESNSAWVAESCDWFFRSQRCVIALELAAPPVGKELVETHHFSAPIREHPFFSDTGAASFFNVSEVDYFAVMDTRSAEYFQLWLPADCYVARHVPYGMAVDLGSAFNPEEWAFYAVPQMVHRRVFAPPSLLTWTPTHKVISRE